MKSEIKKQWVEALRSGRYWQGNTLLRHRRHFCCLGVLCDLAVKARLDVTVEKHGDEFLYDGEVFELPMSVSQWAGLDDQSPDIGAFDLDSGQYKTTSLARINDNGATFKQIADLIEEQL